MSKASVILTVFNKEKYIGNVIDNLYKFTSEFVNEYIFVIDGCTDGSEQIIKDKLQYIPSGCSYQLLYANDVFELRANNIGLRACSNDFAIIIQDDMLIMEDKWDERLSIPVNLYKDIWAVTARTTCSLNTNGEWYNIIEGPVGCNYNKNTTLKREDIYVGQVVNRGPLLVRMSVMKDIGYFDETLPGCIGCDDVDACLKVFKNYKLRCCSFWIGYNSPLEWGSTRTGPNTSYCTSQESLNKHTVISRYSDILQSWNYDEIRSSVLT